MNFGVVASRSVHENRLLHHLRTWQNPMGRRTHHRLAAQRGWFCRANAGEVVFAADNIQSINQNGAPETVTIDKSGANLAALEAINAERETPIKIRQNKYLNNTVEQDH
jgi:DDE domain